MPGCAAAQAPHPSVMPHVGAGLMAAAATELVSGTVSSDHSLAVALITAVGGICAIISGQVAAEIFRRHRNGNRRGGGLNQDELVEHLLEEIDDLRGEIARLKRRREP